MRTTAEELKKHFELSGEPVLQPRYNIAPSQQVGVVREPQENQNGERTLDSLQWGLVPFWSDDRKIGNKLINARSETADEKPSFRAAFKTRRCLVPADGFYEWKKGENGKQPYYIRKKDDGVFGFAGLWESWEDEESGDTLETFTILTTDPNRMIKPIHDRMPVILHPSRYDAWLDPANEDTDKLKSFLTPYQSDELTAHPVSKHVNSPQNDDERCIEPMES